MKLRRFISLLTCDFPGLWGAVGLALAYGFMNATSLQRDHMFMLGNRVTDSFLLIIPFMSINALFLNGNYGIAKLQGQVVNNLEFLFTKAIRRSSLFWAKTSLYLGLSLLPLLVSCGYSHTKPEVRMELPYHTLADREASKQFFLTHFEGAHLQEPDTGQNKDYVVLPNGQVQQSIFTLGWVFLVTVLFQALTFSFPPNRRWLSVPIFFGLMFFLAWVGRPMMETPSYYEAGLAWMTGHPLIALVGLMVLTVVAQIYCRHRFVRTEVVS